MSLFPSLPDEAQVWLFAADRTLNATEIEKIHATMAPFVASWKTHGRPVAAGFEVLADRILVLAGHIPGDNVSGCGVDAATDAVAAAVQPLGLSWHSSLEVLYRSNGEIRTTNRPGFRQLAAAGEVTPETKIFDFTVDRLGAIRNGALEKPAADTWLARYFDVVRSS